LAHTLSQKALQTLAWRDGLHDPASQTSASAPFIDFGLEAV
jgi:hypothetical protein